MLNGELIQMKNKRFVYTGGRPFIVFKTTSQPLPGGTALIISDSLALSTTTCLTKTGASSSVIALPSNTFAVNFSNASALSSLQPTVGLHSYSATVGCHSLGTRLSEVSSSGLVSVYPNPCRDEIQFEIKQQSGLTVSFELYSLSGNLLKTETLQRQSNLYRIKLPELPAALYLYKIREGDQLLQVGKLLHE